MSCSCGQDAWLLGSQPIIALVEEDGKVKHNKGHRLAMMTCDECGRVEFYHMDAVARAAQRVRDKLEMRDVTPTD